MIRLVTADPAFALEHRDGLVVLLRATVGNGAPLGFLHPLSESDARAYWDGVIASLQGGKRVVVLALDDDHVVGSAQIELASKQNAGHRAEVQKVSVLAEYRNRGVGRMLMEAIESEARRLGRSLLLLDTREGGYAERFYESLGWTRAGRIPGYFYDETGTLHATIIFHKTIAEGTATEFSKQMRGEGTVPETVVQVSVAVPSPLICLENSVAVPSAQRFTNRVDDYVRGRPGYPAGVVATLASRFGLEPSWTIADVGAGTGISAAMLLEAGCAVIAVEPNTAMREIALSRLGENPRFRAVDAAAEATTLPDRSVDAVFAAQAFHWFDRARFRTECLRILKPRGAAALIWNIRKAEASPFAAAYEALIREFATDYLKVRHENVSEHEIASFFGAPHERHDFDNVQVLDRDGLRARLVSSSYVPGVGQPRHDAMVAALERLFDEHQVAGVVELPYDASLFVGRPA